MTAPLADKYVKRARKEMKRGEGLKYAAAVCYTSAARLDVALWNNLGRKL